MWAKWVFFLRSESLLCSTIHLVILQMLLSICILHARVFENWKQTGGEFSFTGDARLTNFKLVISNYAALYAFAHYHIHVIFTVYCRGAQ